MTKTIVITVLTAVVKALCRLFGGGCCATKTKGKEGENASAQNEQSRK